MIDFKTYVYDDKMNNKYESYILLSTFSCD